jgi:hypothetical protein
MGSMNRAVVACLLFSFLATRPVGAQLRESAGPWKAGGWKQYITFEVQETAGIDRQQEPVEVGVRLPDRNIRLVRWGDAPEEIVSQVVEARFDGAAYKLRVVFPATVPARATVLYRVYYGQPDAPAASYSASLKVSQETRVGWAVENEHYKADAGLRSIKGQDEDSGQIQALTLNCCGVTLLRSGGGRMHWGPNFRRTGAPSYRTIGNWEPVQSIERVKGPVVCESRRSGFHAEYPEIKLDAVYRFFAFVPYFRFRSEMLMSEALDLFLLRNDEMTMDAFFTHVAWPGKTAASPVQSATLEEREKTLEKQPIPADAPWICFYNGDKGYGYGSVRLHFDNRNTGGKPSPLYHPYTKISDGAGGGRYWNRRLIDEHDTRVPAGSRYLEDNAYVVFRLRAGPPAQALGEFLEWEKKLRKPLQTELQGSKAWTARQKAAKK